VLLLEKPALSPGGRKERPGIRPETARLGDLYVNDAFGTAHRRMLDEGVTRFFKQSAAGFLMMKELDYLGKVVGTAARPYVAVLGGAKISGKIDVITNLLPKVDQNHHRRRHGLHLPQGPGLEVRQFPGRAGQGGLRRQASRRGQG